MHFNLKGEDQKLIKSRKTDNILLLTKTIDSFNRAVAQFQTYYQTLETRVGELDMELNAKNNELEINLREKEEVKNYLNNIFESLTTGIVVIDQNGDITIFNRAAEKITGFLSKDVIGEKINDILGKKFLLNLNKEFFLLDEFNKKAEYEIDILDKNNQTVNLSLSIAPVKKLNQDDLGKVLAIQDITRIKKLEAQANRTCRLTAMGEMAVNIAHEIRNPLGSIELFAGALRKDLQGADEPVLLTEHISASVKNINNIISNLLLFIKPQQKPDLNKINIHDVINDSLFFSHLVESDNSIQVIKRYDNQPIYVCGDSELLKQVSLNLILNAIQAMPNGGELIISIRIADDIRSKPGFAEIKINDNGTGISKVDISRIFDPFFTTKKKGTGIGLSIVHNIIKAHEGNIDIASSEHGTECIITLPLFSS